MSGCARKKIVVLGGGLGALSAAYWLTQREGWQDEYTITVYQRGWRLGGKGASGRSTTPGYAKRIEEHGPHIWYGFYENAFNMMRRVFAELERVSTPVRTFRSVEEAFARRSLWTVQDEAQGKPVHWPVLFPTNSATPGTEDRVFSWAVVQNVLGFLANGRRILLGSEEQPWWRQSWSAAGSLARVAWASLDCTARRLIAGARHLLGGKAPTRGFCATLIRRVADDLCDGLARSGAQDSRRLCAIVDLAATAAVGILEDDLRRNGFESVDDEELRDWLRRHGARKDTIESHILLQVYDLIFGYVHGDSEQPNLAAGTGARGLIRFALTFKGAFMYEMCAGMGDTIFTPLHALLAARGVRFEFFHRVRALQLDPTDLSRIGSIEMGRQVRLTGESYWPYVRVKGLDCWPSEPDYAQIVEGEKLRAALAAAPDALDCAWSDWTDAETRTLRYGTDFDEVILGIPVAALPAITQDIVQRNPRWREMVEGVQTTRTYCVQLWMTATMEELGWVPPRWMWKLDAASHPPLGLQSILCGYAPGLNAWGDFSHVLPREDWPDAAAPRSVSYFCGALPDPPAGGNPYGAEAAAKATASMRDAAVAALDTRIGRLWPHATVAADGNRFDRALLFNAAGAADPLDAQYWRVNVDPSERYTISAAGTTKKRLPGAASGVRHLYLAGDWTRNGVLNVGCVEGAVASGMEAARALGGVPQRIVGENRYPVAHDRWADALLDELRTRGDGYADEEVRKRLGMAGAPSPGEVVRNLAARRDDDAGLRDSGLLALRAELHPHGDALPLDPVRIRRGQEFFAEHGPEILLVLACYSLPAAYAAAKGAHVLGRTQYLVDDPARRLLETAQMVVDVLTPHALGAGARGVRTAKKVRLMHAAIRQLILAGDPHTPAWDAVTLGVPINQEDLLGTLMTFSWVVLDGVQRLGARVSDGERDAYLEAWRAIGLGLGIGSEYLPVGWAESEVLTRKIQQRQIHTTVPNPVGETLTNALLEMMRVRTPGHLLDPMGASLMRFLLPANVADSLKVPRNLPYDLGVRMFVRLIPAINMVLRKVVGDPHAFRRLSLRFLQRMLDEQSSTGGRPRFEIPTALRDRWWQGGGASPQELTGGR